MKNGESYLSKTMNILAVLPHYGVTASRFLTDAFERIGFNVFRVGPKYDFHLDMQWEDSEMPKIDLELPKNANWYIDDYVDAATRAGCTPDLVFLNEESYDNLIVNTEKVPSVLWSCDGWPQNYARREMIKPTLAYSNHVGIRIHPLDKLPEGWKYLAGGCAPWVHKYLGLERDDDFCLFSTMYGKRPEICKSLIEEGYRARFGQAKIPEYVRWYNKAWATLHNPQPGEIKWRFFEAASMGCLNISWNCQLFERLRYNPWKHYVPIDVPEVGDDPWPSSSQIMEVLDAIRDNHRYFKNIADAARLHTVVFNSYYNRCQTILADLGMEKEAEQCQPFIDGAWKEHLGEL